MKNIRNIIKVLKLVIPICPLRMIVYLLLSLPAAVLPAVMLYWQQQIIDSVAHMNSALPLWYYAKQVLLLIGVYMIYKLFDLISKQYMEFGYFRYVFMGLDARIHKKSSQISLEYYDSAEYYQIVQNAKRASMFLVFTANLAILSLVLMGSLLSVGGCLAALHPLLIIFVILVSAPVIIEKVQSAKYHSGLLQDTVSSVRKKKYAFELFLGSSKKELAHHGAGGYIAEKYLKACKEADEKENQHIRRAEKNGLIFAGLKALFHGISICMMTWMLITGRITIGGFSILLASFSTLTNTFTQLFNHAGEILHTSVMSASFFELMELEIKDGNKNIKEIHSIEESEEIIRLKQVSYQYPNAKKSALKDISLSIKKGERIAIVGENGAGKTTLAKLLSGFLLPTKGIMQLGGVPRSELRENSIFEQISAVYQEFGRYKLTLAQNVYLSDTNNTVSEKEGILKMDMEKINNSLAWAGISIADHPEEVFLGKEFGGVELSGGQWQRLALARSYYRQRPILFLDEPTAAIDPLEEMEIYEKLNNLAQGRTVILVTHRLGAVRNADKIIVLGGGEIIEMGNFMQLIEQKGYFYHIWNEQAKWYQEEI